MAQALLRLCYFAENEVQVSLLNILKLADALGVHPSKLFVKF